MGRLPGHRLLLANARKRKKCIPRSKAIKPRCRRTDQEVKAGLRLRYHLFNKFAGAKLSSVDVCELATLIKRAGVTKALDDVALKDDADFNTIEHNASRKVKHATGLDKMEADIYSVDLPICDEFGQRGTDKVPVNLLQDILVDELRPQLEDALEHAQALIATSRNWQNNQAPRMVVMAFGCFAFAL